MNSLLNYPNVVGYGAGYKYVSGEQTKEICTTVLVSKKLPTIALHLTDVIPASVGYLPTDVVEVGIIRALQNRTDEWMPAPPGVSIGHYLITAGTFGCVVKRGDQRFILSNNHVLANENDAYIGDSIYQPGIYDGGREAIASLEEFVPLDFGENGEDDESDCWFANGIANLANGFAKGIGSSHRLKAYREVQAVKNLVDAAIARPFNDGLIVEEILEIGMLTGVAEVDLNDSVKKSGRTTGLTSGTIIVVGATVEVEYSKGVVTLEDQIISTGMSQPGDSGSLLVNEDNKAVGLLFAGSEQVTVHNRIANVMRLLDVVV